MVNAIQTLHKLDFMARRYEPQSFLARVLMPEGWIQFQIGTCEGLYSTTDKTFDIIAVQNEQPGNGHFEDVLQWFEFACKRDGKDLRFLEILNDKFGKHLVKKRGFKWEGKNVIKKIK